MKSSIEVLIISKGLAGLFVTYYLKGLAWFDRQDSDLI